jgi:hypothetical protein
MASGRVRRRLGPVIVSVLVLSVASLVTAASADAAVTWTVQTTPNNSWHYSDFQAVSCPTTTSCMAVGSHGDAGYQVARAERYNGSSWSNTTVPKTAQHFSWFYGVSCTSSTACTAVGADATSKAYGAWGYVTAIPDKIRPMVQRWNGTSWSVQTLPVPSTWTFSYLRGVSCVSATFCVAVGYHGKSPMILSWNGTAWSLQSAATNPPLSSEVRFSGVSCTSTTSCVAVGRYVTASGTRALAEKWNGTAWSLAAPPTPTGTTELTGVSCTSATACIGVGSFDTGTGVHVPLAESWDGAAWTVMTTPVIAGGAHLKSVSCTSSTACMTVGVNRRSGHDHTLAFQLTGTTWTTTSVPDVTTDNLLSAVSCATTTSCLTAGWDVVDGGSVITDHTLAAKWNGSSWTTVTTASDTTPLQVANNFKSVSCSSSTFCAAVGENHQGSRAVSARWDGTAWHATTQPDLSDTGYLTMLSGVSCRSANACIAVGAREWAAVCACPTDEGNPLAESWNGTKWKLLTPAKPNTLARFYGVSCSATTACTAVGGGNSHAALAQRWNGTSWTSQSVPVPTSFSIANLFGVSCASATSCMAVGNFHSTSPSSNGLLAARWNGTSWTRYSVPRPSGWSNGQLNGVSCTSASACTAVGYWVTTTGSKKRRLVERWNGTSWTVFDKQSSGGAEQQLASVSCRSATACTAVGTKQTSTYDQTLAWHLNGTTISLSSPKNPGGFGNDLLGVSCTSSTVCTAVGQRAVSAGTQTLAERSGP